ncbi:MAG: DNA repair protein RecN, partial [Desulfuromonadaceae bacterium]
RPELHLELLDGFAAAETQREVYEQLYEETRLLEERLQRLDEAERERQQRLDFLGFQSRELAETNLRSGEDEELDGERRLLLHAERLAGVSVQGYDLLYGADGAVCERLETTAAGLEALTHIDPAFSPWIETLRSALYGLEDVAIQLRDYAQKVQVEPGRLQEVEERLAQLANLKRKYAPTIAEIMALHQRIDAELAELADLESTRAELSKTLGRSREKLLQAGKDLTALRRQGGVKLKQRVEAELAGLAMERAHFEMRLEPLAKAGPRGLEKGEFYLSPNQGEEPKPLARIASGGELSRIMLALQSAAPRVDTIPTRVFDEVDAGIGGEAATAVGEKLHRVAEGWQIICITHLPQVAAFADVHYRVEKQERQGRTFTALVRLTDEERIREMARMLGGAKITARALEHARELIGASNPG